MLAPEQGSHSCNRVPAIYVRVSTREQTLGYSLDEQKNRCREHLKNLGMKYHRFYVDDGHSGKTLQRPAMQQLLEDIIDGRISHVVVWKLDRLSRNLTDTLLLIEDLANGGIGVISVTQSIDTTTTIGKIVISVLSGFSQIELENIQERVRLGVEGRLKKGLWQGGSPFGYDYDKELGKLVVNPEESKVVKEIFKRYLQWRSFGRVRSHLIKKGIKTRKGNTWNDTTIGAILSRELYTGIMKNYHGPVKCPELRIIPKKAYKQAQEIREARRGLSPRFKKRKAEIYSGGHFCVNCGSFMEDEARYCGECGGRCVQ